MSDEARAEAERIAELEAEVEQWRRVAVEQTRLERDRAEAAEAKLAAAVRALHQRAECLDMQGEPYDPPEYYCEHCYPNVWNWPCPTIQAIEGDQA